MWTGPLAALLVQVALAGSAALLSRRAKPAAALLGAAAFLGAPWLAGPIPLLRGLSALLGGIGLLRVVDLVRGGESWSAWRRVLHVLSFVDSRTLRPAPRQVDLPAVGSVLLWSVVSAAGFYIAHSPEQLVRWGGGLVFVYAAIESGYALFGAAYRALGFVTPPLHIWPIASLSVAELWGVRWARPISAWLRETCFRPLARRRHPKLGLALAFVASAVGHAYPVVVAIGLPTAAVMFAFFAVQAVFVILEAALGAPRWSRVTRRAWTITLMVASSPLFVEPALRVIGCAPPEVVAAEQVPRRAGSRASPSAGPPGGSSALPMYGAKAFTYETPILAPAAPSSARASGADSSAPSTSSGPTFPGKPRSSRRTATSRTFAGSTPVGGVAVGLFVCVGMEIGGVPETRGRK